MCEEATTAGCWNDPARYCTGQNSRVQHIHALQHLHHRLQVQEALSLAYDAHAGQVRKSGEKYITHPVEVARILAELQMDGESLAAGLLHDTVEDTQDVSFEEIEVMLLPRSKSTPCSKATQASRCLMK